jgi:hypothetical protein
MFKSLSYYTYYTREEDTIIYRLNDDNFITYIRAARHGALRESIVTLAILKTYAGRNLPVAPNLARFYVWQYKKQTSMFEAIERDHTWLNCRFDEYKCVDGSCWLEGCDQNYCIYYPCVRRQVRQLLFSKNLF